nr:MAG TPA: hypothetical protein [Bacteriophage sp.]
MYYCFSFYNPYQIRIQKLILIRWQCKYSICLPSFNIYTISNFIFKTTSFNIIEYFSKLLNTKNFNVFMNIVYS